jgi:hypothetical protein
MEADVITIASRPRGALVCFAPPELRFAGELGAAPIELLSRTFFAPLEDELRGYELRKGTVQFPLTKPVPVKLIGRIAKLRAVAIVASAKKPLLGREQEMRK